MSRAAQADRRAGGRYRVTQAGRPAKNSRRVLGKGGTVAPGFAGCLECLEPRLMLSGEFAVGPTYDSGGFNLRALAIADFNGDGKCDIALTNGQASGSFGVLQGGGDGTFADAAVFSTGGDSPLGLATGDFNEDGKTDVAVCNYWSNNVAVCLGDGGGGFGAPATFPTGGTEDSGVAAGDFNHDGHLDLAVLNARTNNVGILLSDGNGTFSAAQTYPTNGTYGWTMVAGDFNADGNLDLATANYWSDNVSVLLGSPNGSFAAGVTYGTGGGDPLYLTVGDFNEDGVQDLAVSNDTGNLGVLLSSGTGTFQPAVTTSVMSGSQPGGLTAADFNGDGQTDLAVAVSDAWQTQVYHGNGDGTFGGAFAFENGGRTATVTAVGDFNIDGLLDLAVGSYDSHVVSILTHQPLVMDDVASTPPWGSVLIDVLGNDGDWSAEPLSITGVGAALYGTASDNDGKILFVPATGFHGVDSFTYSAANLSGQSGTATVTVYVNTPPVANSDVGCCGEAGGLIAVLGNDTDPDGDPLSILSFSEPPHMAAMWISGQFLMYIPTAGWSGQETFTYTISDGYGGEATGTVDLFVTGSQSNQSPVAVDDSAVTPLDVPASIDVLDNDSDPDDDPLSIDSVDAPVNGAAVINPDNTITYTPNAGFVGADSFGYTVSDGRGGLSTAQVTVTVADVDLPPVAVDDLAEVDEDDSVIIDVLTNDFDPNQQQLTVVSVTSPSHGTAVILANNTIRYTPNADFEGIDTFSYVIEDTASPQVIAGLLGTAGQQDTALVTVVVTGVNDDPVAEDDFAYTAPMMPVVIDVLANDWDVEDDTLTVTGVGTNRAQSVTIQLDGSLLYVPQSAWIGTDIFTYTISDGSGGTATGTVRVTVSILPAQNRPPVFYSTPVTVVSEGQPYSYQVLAGDPEAGAVTLTLLTGPSGLSFNPASGMLTGTFDDWGVGNHLVRIEAADGQGNTTLQQFTVTVANVAPVWQTSFTPYPWLHVEDAAFSLDVDTDIESIAAAWYTISPDDSWASIDSATGEITGTPDNGQVGLHTFVVTATDQHGAFVTGAVQVSVGNRPVSFTSLPPADVLLNVGEPFFFDFDSDDEGQGSTAYALTAGPAGAGIDSQTGLLSASSTSLSDIGDHTVTVQVDDGNGATASYSLVIHVSGTAVVLDLVNGPWSYSFVDLDGDRVTVSATGSAGLIRLLLPAGPLGPDITAIQLEGTDASVNLSIAVRKTAVGGTGFTALGSLTGATPLGQFKAPGVDLVGAGIDLTGDGFIITTDLHDVRDGASILMDGFEPRALTFRLGKVEGGGNLLVQMPVALLSAAQWEGGAIGALGFGKIKIAGDPRRGLPGDLRADIIGAGTGLVTSLVTVAGGASGTWDFAGPVTTLDVAGPAQDLGFIALGDVKTLRLRQVADSFVEVHGLVATLTAGEWLGGSIQAAGVKTLTIPGQVVADLTLTGLPLRTTATLGRADIGELGDGESRLAWHVAGGIGTLNVSRAMLSVDLLTQGEDGSIGALNIGSMIGCRVFAGLKLTTDPATLPTDSAGMLDLLTLVHQAAEIKVLNAGGQAAPADLPNITDLPSFGFVQSLVGAGRMGRVTVRDVETSSPYGIGLAADRIESYKRMEGRRVAFTDSALDDAQVVDAIGQYSVQVLGGRWSRWPGQCPRSRGRIVLPTDAFLAPAEPPVV